MPRELLILNVLYFLVAPQGFTDDENKGDMSVFHIILHAVPHTRNKDSHPDFTELFGRSWTRSNHKWVYKNADLVARKRSIEVPQWHRVCARL